MFLFVHKYEDGSRVWYISKNNITESSNSVPSCLVCMAYIALLYSRTRIRTHSHSHLCTQFFFHFAQCAQLKYNIYNTIHTLTSFLCICACVRACVVRVCPCLCPFIHMSYYYCCWCCCGCCRAAYGGTHKKMPYHKSSCALFSPNNNTMENHFVHWFLFSYHIHFRPFPLLLYFALTITAL